MLNQSKYLIEPSHAFSAYPKVGYISSDNIIIFSSVGATFKDIFTNNKTTLTNIISAISNSETYGAYFKTNNGNDEHVREDKHYGNE